MEIAILFKIAALGIIVAVINQVLAHLDKKEYTIIVTLSGLIIGLMMVLPAISDLFDYIKSIFDL
ncbi:MAG: stage III sporulation protein AC [Oscillospiraceae bacterium]|nr:stage III sporulation protein AC [Oscillospiraceae bacterium]